MINDPSEQPAAPPVLPVARRLFPFRFWFLAAYLLAIGGFCTWLGTSEGKIAPIPWEVLLVFVGIAAVLQAAFLAGLPHFRWPRPTGRRPMWVSIATGAFVAGLLSSGLAGTAMSLFQADEAVGHVVNKLNGNRTTFLDIPWPLWAFVGINWLIWLLIFSAGYTSRWLPKFRWIYRTLIAGTWLELLITIPVDAAVRKRTTCYCGEGTFFAMAVGITMAFWTFGPGLAILFLTRRLQRRSNEPICTICGYDLRGLAEPRCPECGQPFDRRILMQHQKAGTYISRN